jgi:hypothetical protein
VERGRQQLLDQDISAGRVRRAGGGPSVGKTTPDMVAALERLLEHDKAGDSISGLRWSRPTTGKMAELLTQHGWRISPNTVARFLHHLDYSSTGSKSPPSERREAGARRE